MVFSYFVQFISLYLVILPYFIALFPASNEVRRHMTLMLWHFVRSLLHQSILTPPQHCRRFEINIISIR